MIILDDIIGWPEEWTNDDITDLDELNQVRMVCKLVGLHEHNLG